jgi:hypothetical protein
MEANFSVCVTDKDQVKTDILHKFRNKVIDKKFVERMFSRMQKQFLAKLFPDAKVPFKLALSIKHGEKNDKISFNVKDKNEDLIKFIFGGAKRGFYKTYRSIPENA